MNLSPNAPTMRVVPVQQGRTTRWGIRVGTVLVPERPDPLSPPLTFPTRAAAAQALRSAAVQGRVTR